MNETSLQLPNGRVGEVVEASTTTFTSQCYRLYEAPPLGSLVRSGDNNTAYGIVSEVSTRSLDPARHPIPRGEAEEVEESVYLSNPQLSRLLATEFRSVAIGHYSHDGKLRRYPAPLPPHIYSFVYRCGKEETRVFSQSLDFVGTLLASPIGVVDEVIASFLEQASLCHQEPDRFLIEAGRELAVLLGSQTQRLNGVLRRLSP